MSVVFLDGDPGPEIRRKLNEMVLIWDDATGNAVGWAPVLAVISDSERRVYQITDWIGGAGTKPVIGKYIGASGFVDTAAEAIDVRGPQGVGVSPEDQLAFTQAAATATTKASEASQSAADALDSENAADISETNAGISAGTASVKAAESAAAALSALNAPGTNATSTSSLLVGTGSKTLTIQTGKLFAIGQWVVVANTPSPANWMMGQITAHNSATGSLTFNSSEFMGSGTYAAWTVSHTAPGAQLIAVNENNLLTWIGL